jgi:hypothetical protein
MCFLIFLALRAQEETHNAAVAFLRAARGKSSSCGRKADDAAMVSPLVLMREAQKNKNLWRR